VLDVRHRLRIDVHRHTAVGVPQQFLHGFHVLLMSLQNFRVTVLEIAAFLMIKLLHIAADGTFPNTHKKTVVLYEFRNVNLQRVGR
jgi:hypothetical protein